MSCPSMATMCLQNNAVPCYLHGHCLREERGVFDDYDSIASQAISIMSELLLSSRASWRSRTTCFSLLVVIREAMFRTKGETTSAIVNLFAEGEARQGRRVEGPPNQRIWFLTIANSFR